MKQKAGIGKSENQEGGYQAIRQSGLNTNVFIRVDSWFRCNDLF